MLTHNIRALPSILLARRGRFARLKGSVSEFFFELQGFLPACSVNSARCTLVSC